MPAWQVGLCPLEQGQRDPGRGRHRAEDPINAAFGDGGGWPVSPWLCQSLQTLLSPHGSAKGSPSPTALLGPLILLWAGTFQGQLLEYGKELPEVLGGEVGPAQSQVQDLQASIVRVWNL